MIYVFLAGFGMGLVFGVFAGLLAAIVGSARSMGDA